MEDNSLRICTLNCRSLKSSFQDVNRLCDTHDIVCLQEHWLLPSELGLLNNIHNDFYGTGSSAVDVTSDVLVGRPYGGTAILYRKTLCNLVRILPTSNLRITGLNICTGIGPLLLFTVYMPTDYNDDDSLEKYIDVCAHMNAMLNDCDIPNVLIAGDFNCQPGSRFFCPLMHLIDDNSLVVSDISLLSALNDVFTYCSDNGSNISWIDHVIGSHAVNSSITDMKILYDFICSDHRPMSFVLNCHCQITLPKISDTDVDSRKSVFHDWSKVDAAAASFYSNDLFDSLCLIDVPDCLHSCCHTRCNNTMHISAIDNYYNDVINCVKCSVDRVIPVKTGHHNEFNVPGWNDFVQEKYDASREAFLTWVYSGRPHSGVVFTRMSRSRASFKLALRYCRQHEDQLRADACAKSLNLRDSKSFWNNVKKVNCDKATKYANCVGGISGDENIASLWRDHFNTLYNSVEDDISKEKFQTRINSNIETSDFDFISVQEINDAIRKQKKGKAVGPDGIAMEAFIFGNARLLVHLSFLFNLFITHCHIPAYFMQSVIVPLVKVKSGDLGDVNNYRAIALSNSISKILESVFMSKVTSTDVSDCHQFGFKAGHSTGLCTMTLKKVVEYYTDHGSHVFVSFVDFSKAFDKVNYWKLFNGLLDDKVDVNVVALLAFWYSNQSTCICWKNTLSRPFTIGNGTRQGGLLSPYFFTRYIRELIRAIVLSNFGCNIGGVFFNILAYADDLVLLAPSWKALQQLISLLHQYAVDIDMTCNVAKTVCMVFQPKNRKMIVDTEFPCFAINGANLQYVSQFKYLGHIINNDFSDDDDIKREIHNLFMRSNILTRRHSKCSVPVKLMLFKAYCLCLYDAAIWIHYSVTVYNKLRSCYNKCIKMFFNYKRCDSVTLMLAELNLPSFDNCMSSSADSFAVRQSVCCNTLVSHLNSLLL